MSEDGLSLRRELQAILTLYLGTILTGYNLGFSAVAIPDIKEEKRSNTSYSVLPAIELTDEDVSWFASTYVIGGIIGSLLGGYFGGRFGPKRTILASCVPAALGWILISSSPHLSTLIIGRILCGLSAECITSNCPLLVAEYSSLKRRGGFLALFGLMIGVGVLACYCLGALLYWRVVAAVPPLLCLLFLLSLWRVPESPLWLLAHRGKEECQEALQWLRGTEEVGEEIIQIEEVKEKQSHGLTMTEAIRNLARPDVRTPFLLITANCLFTMLSGPFAIIFYSVEIFQDTGIDKYLASILSAVIRVLGSVLGIFLVHKLPRVKLSMVMMTLMSISMAILGTVLYLNVLTDIVPIISVTLYMFCYGAGAAPLMWVYFGELLPREYKVLSGIIIFIMNISIFIVTKIFPTLLAILSPAGTYWLFAAISLGSNILYVFFMPETSGKNAAEIKRIFVKIVRQVSRKLSRQLSSKV